MWAVRPGTAPPLLAIAILTGKDHQSYLVDSFFNVRINGGSLEENMNQGEETKWEFENERVVTFAGPKLYLLYIDLFKF